jgi:hypothetical protein
MSDTENEEKKSRGRPKTKKDTFIELEEKFDQHKLNHILQNEEKYRNQMRARCFDDDYNPFAIIGKYLAKSNNGVIKAKYKQNNSMGRFYALQSISLQSMAREIRHTIAGEFYTDIDIKNAHPVILAHLCEERGIKCKLLKQYNKKRDEFLAAISDDKDAAKVVVLSMINGGKTALRELDSPPDFLNEFRAELKTIHSKFAKDAPFKSHKYKRIEAGVDFNHEASYMNTLLCDFENKILQVIYMGLGSPKDCVLCFDGLMIRKGVEFNLETLEELVLDKLDIEIKLAIKPMTEGFEIENIEPYIPTPTNCFNFTDPYNYNNFHTQFNNSTFDSYESMDSALSDYPRVIAHILQGDGYFIKKLKNGELDVTKKLRTSDFHIDYGEKTKKSFEQYICTKQAFGQIACELENCPEDEFNIWTGFQAKRVNCAESDGLKLIKSFIMESWANNDTVIYNYIISWFAGLVTNLKGINRVALAMISEQGTGKGTLIDFMDLVLRAVNIVSVTGISSITGKFNTILQGKRLVNINEMSSTKDEFKSNFDKIKSYITDPTIVIEPKGVNPYKIKNIANLILFTNHRDAIIVEESDRRYAIFEMSSAHMNDTEYFGKIRKECFNQSVADEFYTYLLDFPAVDISKIPQTELKQEMMNMSKPTPLKFLDSVREDNIFDSGAEVGASDFYSRYQRWCSDNGERNVLTATKFGTIISTKLVKRKAHGRMVYVI